jgi:hypothetical protein
MNGYPEIVSFPECNTIFAKDQPEYRPLPAHRYGDEQGKILFCWRLSWRDRLRVLWTGLLWHQVLTFRHPLQPQLITIEKPELSQSAKTDLC